MICVGFDVSGKSLGSDAITQRKQRVCEGKQLVSQAGLRALLRQLGAKLDNFEVGNQMKGIAEMMKKITVEEPARKLLITANGVLKYSQPYDPRTLAPATG